MLLAPAAHACVQELALDAVQTVSIDQGGQKEIDIKNYAKVEKIPGGTIEDCRVLKGERKEAELGEEAVEGARKVQGCVQG